MSRIFYTYVAVDLRKPGKFSYEGCNMSFLYEPFYVGKGFNARYASCGGKNREVVSLMSILGDPSSFTIVIHHLDLESCLSEDFAFLVESRMISSIGRIVDHAGPLLNLTTGWQGSYGYTHSPEVRKRISDILNSYEIKKKLSDVMNSEEYRQKQSKSHRGRSHILSEAGRLSIVSHNSDRAFSKEDRVKQSQKARTHIMSLTPNERSQRASKAAQSRWGGR